MPPVGAVSSARPTRNTSAPTNGAGPSATKTGMSPTLARSISTCGTQTRSPATQNAAAMPT